jgi:hypothetical protein
MRRGDDVVAAHPVGQSPATATPHHLNKIGGRHERQSAFERVIGLVDITYRDLGSVRSGATFAPSQIPRQDTSMKIDVMNDVPGPRAQALGTSARAERCRRDAEAHQDRFVLRHPA